MCRKMKKSPAFQAGDELFQGYFAWFSSIGSHMCQQSRTTWGLFRLILHSKSLLLCNRTEIIARKSAFVDKLKRFFSKMWYCLPIDTVILLLLLQKELSAINGQLLVFSALISEDWDVF